MRKPIIIVRRREENDGPTVIRLPPKKSPPKVVIMERKTEPTVIYRRNYSQSPMTGAELAVLGLIALGTFALVALVIWAAAQEQALYDDGDVIIID